MLCQEEGEAKECQILQEADKFGHFQEIIDVLSLPSPLCLIEPVLSTKFLSQVDIF